MWCFVAACPPATQTRLEDLGAIYPSQRGVACETNVLHVHVWIQFHGALRAQCALTVYDVTTWSWVNLVNPRFNKIIGRQTSIAISGESPYGPPLLIMLRSTSCGLCQKRAAVVINSRKLTRAHTGAIGFVKIPGAYGRYRG